MLPQNAVHTNSSPSLQLVLALLRQWPRPATGAASAASVSAPQHAAPDIGPAPRGSSWPAHSTPARTGVPHHRVSGTLELLWKLWRHEKRPERRVLIEEQICRLCAPLVASLSRGVGGHGTACAREDLIQEGFIALLSCLRRYQPDSGVDFAAFVPKRIRGAMLDAAARLKHLPPPVPAEPRPREPEAPWISELAVQQMLSPLDPMARCVVIYCIIDGLTTRQAAKKLGMHASTVSRKLSGAMITLRQHRRA